MRVVQVNKFYHPTIGGIERVVQTIAEGLDDEYTTRVLTARERGRGTVDRVDGVPVVRAPSLGVALSTPLAPTFPLQLRRETANADIVHHHLPNPLSTVSHALVDKGETPVVATYHSDIVRQAISGRLYRPLLNRFLDAVDRIVATSPRLVANSDVLAAYESKCRVIPLSVDPSRLSPDGATLNVEGPVVLFVGRLVYYKGVEYLIDAMQSVDATLLIIGDGPRRTELKRRTERMGLHDGVRFLGHVDESTLQAAYRTADAFVLPSIARSEAFGLVQLEAMAHGTPVINTDLPTGVPWVSKDGHTGLTVPPRDTTALADALNALLDDPKRRQRYGRHGRERVEKRFSTERMLSNTERLYDDIYDK